MLGETFSAAAYSVTGGTALIDGTGYAVKRGMTLVDGVAYEIGGSPVPVTITGNGNESNCYCEIGGAKYYAATSGVETSAGDIIHLYAAAGQMSVFTVAGKITINGTSVGSGNTKSYDWTVPDDISEITIAFKSGNSNEITVTTA